MISDLWAHQKAALEKSKGWDYFGFLFEVGCGKTRTTIDACEHKYWKSGKTLKTLVFTPLVVVENFKREFEKFGQLSRDKVVALTGSNKDRLRRFGILQNGNYVVITNYEVVYHAELYQALKAWHPQIVIFDEIHKLKDIKAKRTKLCIDIADNAAYRYGLSGTPVLNSQLDLFSQVRALDGGATFGRNFFVFRQQYFYDANAGRRGTTSYFPNWVPRPGINEELQKKIEPFTSRARKSECMDLPPFLTKQVFVEMGPEQTKAYTSMKKDFVAYLKDKACIAELAITKSLRLQQIVSGYIKLEDASGKESEIPFPENPRIDALQGLLEDIVPYAKVIIWCAFKENYRMIRGLLDGLKIPFSELTGDTKDRQVEIDKFQTDPLVRAMIANPGAGGIGVNLTAASYMIYYSKTFSLEHDIQSEGRAYRGGSEIHNKITRIDLVCKNTIDEIILGILNDKKEIGEAILDNKEIILRLQRDLL